MPSLIVNEFTYLEEIKLEHAEVIFSAINDNRPFLSEWLPFVSLSLKKEDTAAFIRSILNSGKDELYVIWHKNEFSGLISFKEIDWANQKTEIGYWLVEKNQGNGIMTQCTLKLIDHAFTNKNLRRIQIKTAKGNTKSSAIPKRLGFVFEGIERHGERHGNKFHDLEIYSILKSEFLATRK